MSLADAILTFGTGTYARARTGAGAYGSDGMLTQSSTAVDSIVASVQPVSGRELQNLPEAQHSSEILVVYTKSELRPRTREGAGDRLVIDGEWFDVFKVEKWVHPSSTHYRAYASKAGISLLDMSGALAKTLGALSLSAAGTVA